MNAIRSLISLFILVLVGLSVAGWIWAGSQPAPVMVGSRLALAVCALAGIGGLVLLWRSQPNGAGGGHR